MMIRITILTGLLLFSASLLADVLRIKEDAPQQYVVKKGDTLWDISGIYLEKPWLWPKLWRWNPQINNPHLIYPGDMISLQYDADGNPVLTVNKRYKKLSPDIKTSIKKTEPVTTIPFNYIQPYLSWEQILPNTDVSQYPMVLGGNRAVKTLTEGHFLYVDKPLERGKWYGIYHQGDIYTDDVTGEIIGQQAILTGVSQAVSGDLSPGDASGRVLVDTAFREIKQGDFLMPIERGISFPALYELREPNIDSLAAKVIGAVKPGRAFSRFDVLVINAGEVSGLSEGDILAIKRRSPDVYMGNNSPEYLEDASTYERLVADMSAEDNFLVMPEETIAHIMVIRTFDKVSYALITQTQQPVRVGDSITLP